MRSESAALEEGSLVDQRAEAHTRSLQVVGFLSGGAAGLARVAVGHPFDTLKVRVQTGAVAWTDWSPRGILSLYRGITPPLLGVGLTTSLNFGIYENAKLTLTSWRVTKWRATPGEQRAMPGETLSEKLLVEFLAGCVAGGSLSLATCPLENAKIQQQTSALSKSVSGWIHAIYARNGLSGLFRGVIPHLIQAGAGRGFYISAYFWAKALEDGLIYPPYPPQSRKHQKEASAGKERAEGREKRAALSETVIGKVVAGAVAGVAGWSFTYPFDVVRSNIMKDWKVERHRSTLSCLLSLWKTGGLRQLYSGMGFTLIRAIPVAAIALPTYDIVRTGLLKMLPG